MGRKCRMIVLLICTIVILFGVLYSKKNTDYQSRLLSELKNGNTAQVSDVFRFSFDRAYVFDDCYISGDGFAKAYELDLSIGEVKSGVSESIHRIVFVDKNGTLVYEFRYNSNRLVVDNEGVVIYPNTIMSLCSDETSDITTIRFESTEYYSK